MAKPNVPATGADRPRDPSGGAATSRAFPHFRFYDNRQKYLLFVTTCDEKWVVAERVGREAAALSPRPPAFRLFDAGMGDGTVLAHVLRHLHQCFPTVPFYVVGKEISLEDARMSLDKMPDRLCEHPETVFVVTNLYYREAPWLRPEAAGADALAWHEVALEGSSAHAFAEQIQDLREVLARGWQVTASPRTGNLLYRTPSVLVLYRADRRFVLDRIIPRPGEARAGYDLVIASHPYRARATVAFKVSRILAPLARSLGPGGRMVVIQSYGRDPGLEVVRKVWPGENPFTTDRRKLAAALSAELAPREPDLSCLEADDETAIFRYHMHMLPNEIADGVGTSTLLAAWNAATYVAQIEEERLAEALASGVYLEATAEVLRRRGGLWFNDESFIVARGPA